MPVEKTVQLLKITFEGVVGVDLTLHSLPWWYLIYFLNLIFLIYLKKPKFQKGCQRHRRKITISSRTITTRLREVRSRRQPCHTISCSRLYHRRCRRHRRNNNHNIMWWHNSNFTSTKIFKCNSRCSRNSRTATSAWIVSTVCQGHGPSVAFSHSNPANFRNASLAEIRPPLESFHGRHTSASLDSSVEEFYSIISTSPRLPTAFTGDFFSPLSFLCCSDHYRLTSCCCSVNWTIDRY